MSVASVSANSVDDSSVSSKDTESLGFVNPDVEVLSAGTTSGSDNVLGSSEVISYSDLDILIKSTPNGETLELPNDVYYNDTTDSSYATDGIILKKKITIDGKGHTINANGQKVFTLNSDGITLKNIIITKYTNASNIDGIVWNGDNGLIDNVTFSEGYQAIVWYGYYGKIINTKFLNTKKYQPDGGPSLAHILRIAGSHFTICDSSFTNSQTQAISGHYANDCYENITVDRVNFTGMVSNETWANAGIFVGYNEFKITNCRFINCSGKDSACIASYFVPVYVDNCYFETNVQHTTSRGQSSGIILDRAGGSTITNCKFVNNKIYGGGTITSCASTIENCTFINTTQTLSETSDECKFSSGVYFMVGGASLRNCTFTQMNQINIPLLGFYLQANKGSYSLENCTIYNNTFSHIVGQVGTFTGNITSFILDGTRIYNNTIRDVLFDFKYTTSVSYKDNQSLVYDNYNLDGAEVSVFVDDIQPLEIIMTARANSTNFTDVIKTIYKGGTVYLDPGTYNVGTFTIPNPVTLKGSKGTIFNSSTLNVYFTDNVHFENIDFVNSYVPFTDSPYCSFENCTFSNRSNAIMRFYHGYSINLKNVTFYNLSGTFFNEILHMSTWEDITIVDCTGHANAGNFINMKYYNFNITNNRLSGFSLYGTNNIIENITFKDAYSNTFFNVGHIRSKIINLTVVDNVTCGSNYLFNAFREVYNSTFNNINQVLFRQEDAGGVITLHNVTFNNVHTSAVATSDSSVYIDGLNITDSEFDTLNFKGDIIGLNIRDSNFTSGVVLTLTDNVKFSGSSLDNVSGHISVTGRDVVVNGSSFRDCNNLDVNGSVICVVDGDYISFKDCNFTDNNADYGGAIYIDNETARPSFVNCNFTNNIASSAGGAIYIAFIPGSGTIVTIDNFTESTLNQTGASRLNYYRVNGFYGNLTMAATVVYVVNDTSTWVSTVGDCKSWETAGPFSTAYDIAGKDCVFIFVRSGDVFNYTGNTKESLDSGWTFKGNDTTIVNLRFQVTKGGLSAYDITYVGSTHGSVVVIDDVDVLFDDCKFVNNAYTGDFGVVVVNAGGVNFTGCEFINNTLTNDQSSGFGGALYINASNVRVDDCSFTGNQADYGANIYMEDNELEGVFIINCDFRDSVSLVGSGVLVTGTNLEISNNTFENNTGLTSALKVNNVMNCKVLNNTFVDNKATGDGGALHTNFNTLGYVTIDDNNFVGNNATNGGAWYNERAVAGVFSVDGNNFTRNTATSNGGAVYVDATGVSLVNCNFTNNNATQNGGALYLTSNANNSEISECNFINNSANSCGAISANANIQIISSKFINDTSIGGNAGACYFARNATIDNCKFINCVANSTGWVSGGALISWVGSNNNQNYLKIYDTSFENCYLGYSGSGGAVYSNVPLTAVNCSFIDNGNAANGGAIYLNSKGSITNCTFTDNNATNGGAINLGVDADNTNIKDCNFTNNSASSNGGAIYIVGDNVTVTGCNFTKNNATLGGAIYVAGNNVTVTGSEFTDNTATNGSAIYVNTGVNGFTVKSSTFKGNNASEHGTVYIEGVSGLSFGANTFSGNSPSDEPNENYFNLTTTSEYKLSKIYVSDYGTGLGTSSTDAITLDNAWDHMEDTVEIVLVGTTTGNLKNLENQNVTIVGNGHVLNRKSSASDKYMFNLPIISIDIIN